MIKLFSLKEEKAKEAAAGSSDKKIAPGLIRMQKGTHSFLSATCMRCVQTAELSRALACAAQT